MSTFTEHLQMRGLTPEIRCLVEEQTEQVYFWLDQPTKIVGYQKYDWNAPKLRSNKGRYFTWITESYKPLAVWGLSRLNLSHWSGDGRTKRVLVTEGIWDAIRCIQCGYDAVAVLTATPSRELRSWFKKVLWGVETVGILDNDESEAGKGLTRICDRAIMCELHKDIGDHSKQEAEEWLVRKNLIKSR